MNDLLNYKFASVIYHALRECCGHVLTINEHRVQLDVIIRTAATLDRGPGLRSMRDQARQTSHDLSALEGLPVRRSASSSVVR